MEGTENESRAPAARDFDFLWGNWRVQNRRLRSRLTASNDWEAFTARGACRPVLGGSGNIDDFVPLEGSDWFGFEGGSLRLFDPATEQWSIYWFDNVAHRLLPPVHGRFEDGVGEFSGADMHDGRPVQVRFRWSEITASSARWEQAFSPDSVATWETNWVMDFTRVDEAG